MSLLSEIQADTLDSDVDIANLLRKCMVLASHLGNEDFERWVSYELNGYPDRDLLPPYRIIRTDSYGNFTDGFRMLNNFPIPSRAIPEGYREFATTLYLEQSIGSLIHDINNAKNNTLKFLWPADLALILRYNVYEDYWCLDAYKVVSASTIAGIIDTVKNRILGFVLKIDKEDPNEGETPTGAQPIDPERVQQLVNIHILGNVGNLATGSTDVTQITRQEIFPGDLESLKRYLSGIGIDIGPEDLDELESALEFDEKEEVKETIGSRTKGWIKRMSEKASTGIGAVGVSVASDLISKAIEVYLGLPS